MPAIPWSADRPGCGAGVRRAHGQWTNCIAPPAWAGTIRFRYPRRSVWLAFACDEHRDRLDDPRPLTEADRAELLWRREQDSLALAGEQYERPQPLGG